MKRIKIEDNVIKWWVAILGWVVKGGFAMEVTN